MRLRGAIGAGIVVGVVGVVVVGVVVRHIVVTKVLSVVFIDKYSAK